LTTAQKEAIEHVHLKNEYGLSQADIAKKLGISIDSLADRLRGAEKKLRAVYPEFRKKKKKENRKKESKGEEGPETAKAKHPDKVIVTRIDPKTLARTLLIVDKSARDRIRMKAGVNRFEIKRWVQEICPIPYPAI
jgi:transcriptional regulator with XRE-family HTH domain